MGELGESVLKAGGIEIWSSGNGLGEGYAVTSLSANSGRAFAFEELRAILPEIV